MKSAELVDGSKTRFLLVAIMLTLGVLTFYSMARAYSDDRKTLFTPEGYIKVEVVETENLRRRGLSGRENLGLNEGMLFVFDDSSVNHCFWMKDMIFSLDIIWLSSDKQVVHIENGVLPETFPESFCSDESAQYVLELRAGRARQLGIIDDGVNLAF